MKLPRSIALHYGITAILLGSTITAYAETPKKEMVDTQKIESEVAIEATEKAKPNAEARPAATTSHKKHSVQSHKAKMIKDQKKATKKSIEDAETANPEEENRPAVTTNKTLKAPISGGKHDLMESQKKETLKSIQDEKEVNSATDVRPSATN